MSDYYGAFDVKQLWQMIDAAKQGLGPTREQITAWRRAQQMLDQHADALRGFRNQLAAKWPPESNAASAAYLTELDRLLHAVTATAQSSTSSAVHIGHAADAIEQAHATLQPLHDEYVRNEAKLASYQSQLDAVGTAVGAVNGSVIGSVARGATRLLTEPPVDAGRQEHLLRQAREAMTVASSAARDASINLQPPPEYIPPGVKVNAASRIDSESSNGAARPPMIDQPASLAGAGSSPAGAHLAPGSGPELSANHRVPSSPNSSVVIPSRDSGNNPGPILSERPIPSQPSIEPVGSGPSVHGPVPNDRLPRSPWPATPIISSAENLVRQRLPRRSGSSEFGIGGRNRIQGDSLPASTVIGESLGLPARGGGGGGQSQMQRVSPVGGLIEPQFAGGVATTPQAAGIVGGPRSAQANNGRSADRSKWDPDNPWEVDEGVPPVIIPETVKQIEPGRGIIGIDR